MGKIRNMGTATMRFKEGLYISGSVYQEDGSYSDYALVVTGSSVFDTRDGTSGNSGGITIIKDEQDPVFIRFINDDDPVSWYAYMAMDSAENFYITPGRSQDFYIITRENSGADYFYPFRIFDNGKVKFHQAAQSSADSQTELPADVVFSVSGSKDGQNSAVFGGMLVVSGNVEIHGKESAADETFIQFKEDGSDRAKVGMNTSNNLVIQNQYINKHIVFKVNDQGQTREGLRIDGAVPEVVVNEGSESLVDFRVEGDNKTHMVFVDGSFDLLVLGSDQAMPAGIGSDTNVFVSGSKDGQGQVVVGGNMVVSGSFSAIQKHVVNLKYTATSDANKKYIRFGSNGSNDSPGVNNKWVAPVQGNLLQAVIRSTGTPGNTSLGFHRATDGTENIPTSAVETQEVNLSSANTSVFANFTHAANFGPGDALGFSVDPASNHGNVNITLVFELDFAS